MSDPTASGAADGGDAASREPPSPLAPDGAPGEGGLDAELAALERRLDRLADLCVRLDLENRSLREQQRTLVEERARLIEKNDTARSKVEQMIVRLRSLEAGQ